jgi:hypothetical protein
MNWITIAAASLVAAGTLVAAGPPAQSADPFEQLHRNQEQYQLRQLQDSVDSINSELQYQRARQIERDNAMHDRQQQQRLHIPDRSKSTFIDPEDDD